MCGSKTKIDWRLIVAPGEKSGMVSTMTVCVLLVAGARLGRPGLGEILALVRQFGCLDGSRS